MPHDSAHKTIRKRWIQLRANWILTLALVLGLANGLFADARVCVKGVADLRGIDLNQVGAVRLDGEWAFAWQQLLPPGTSFATSTFTQVPGMWLSSGLSGQGYATYGLRILLPPAAHDLGLKLPELSTAYELWVNGQLVSQNGTVSTDPAQGRAAYEPKLLRLGEDLDTLDLLLHVSNHQFYTGGLPLSVLIGKYDAIASLREAQIVYGAMLFGILLIIGMFHLGIYFFRPKEKYNLYYSLYCLLLAGNTLFVTERWLFAALGPGLWPLCYKFYIATLYLVLLALILFYSAFFVGVIGRWVRQTMSAIFTLQAVLVVVLPTPIGSWLEPVGGINLLVTGIIAIFIFAKAIWQRKEGSIIVAICNFVFIVALILDGTLTANQLSGIHIMHYVTVLYVIAISLILSRRIANAFNNVEALSTDLKSANDELSHLNKNLEAQVNERTRQVLAQEKMAALGQLTANIAHEINTPMGAIKASIETLSVAYRNSLSLFPKAMEELSAEDRGIFVDMLVQASGQTATISSREERQRRKSLAQTLEEAQVPDGTQLAGRLSHAGIYELDERRIHLLRKPGIATALDYLFEHFEQITSTQNIQTALERVSKIMFAIKLYSRGGASTTKTPVNLEHEILATTTLYNSWFKKGIQLQTDFGTLPPLPCLADELLQVWTNLILNAVQSMGSAGTLEIATRKVGNNAVVTIGDTGPGIPADLMDKIFEPFFTTKASGEGSGLGLDIVRTIITRHSGTITVSSQPGHTVFTVTIPYPAD